MKWQTDRQICSPAMAPTIGLPTVVFNSLGKERDEKQQYQKRQGALKPFYKSATRDQYGHVGVGVMSIYQMEHHRRVEQRSNVRSHTNYFLGDTHALWKPGSNRPTCIHRKTTHIWFWMTQGRSTRFLFFGSDRPDFLHPVPSKTRFNFSKWDFFFSIPQYLKGAGLEKRHVSPLLIHSLLWLRESLINGNCKKKKSVSMPMYPCLPLSHIYEMRSLNFLLFNACSLELQKCLCI